MDKTYLERRNCVLVPNTTDPNADDISMVKYGDGVGVLKTSDARIKAELKIVQANGANLDANHVVAIVERPLITIWKEKVVKINDDQVARTNPQAHYASFMHIMSTENIKKTINDPSVKLSHPNNPAFPTWVGSDVAGANGLSATDNFATRRAEAVNHFVLGAGGTPAQNNGGDVDLEFKKFDGVVKRGNLLRNWKYVSDAFYIPCIREDEWK